VTEGTDKLNELFVGVPGSELLGLPPEGETAASPEAASVRRNSTQRREKDSVSSVFSSSRALALEPGDKVDDLDHNEEALPPVASPDL